MDTIERRIYKYIIDKIIEDQFNPKIHSTRWISNKFDVSINKVHKVFTNLVSRNVLISNIGKPYTINKEWINNILASSDRKRGFSFIYKDLIKRENYWLITKEAYCEDLLVAVTKSKMYINFDLKLSDFDNGINYLLLTFTDLEHTYINVKTKLDSLFKTSIVELSKTVDYENKLIEESITETDFKYYQRLFMKNW